MKHQIISAVLVAASLSGSGALVAQEVGAQLWANADRVNRRTCPSTECGSVGQLFFREAAEVFEERDGWIRITKYYDGSCVNDRSQYVDSGNASCAASNGFDGSQFAEWVSADFLVDVRPADPGVGATGSAMLVAQSDDFRIHQAAFVAAADKLIGDGTCTEKNFIDNGGWVKSMNNKTEPVYFMYCGSGGGDRIYLNASTGRTYR